LPTQKTEQEILEEKLEVGKPLEFKVETLFQEWLQLARLNQLKEKRKEVVSPERKKLELLISL
jgi:hypothetical protein